VLQSDLIHNFTIDLSVNTLDMDVNNGDSILLTDSASVPPQLVSDSFLKSEFAVLTVNIDINININIGYFEILDVNSWHALMNMNQLRPACVVIVWFWIPF